MVIKVKCSRCGREVSFSKMRYNRWKEKDENFEKTYICKKCRNNEEKSKNEEPQEEVIKEKSEDGD